VILLYLVGSIREGKVDIAAEVCPCQSSVIQPRAVTLLSHVGPSSGTRRDAFFRIRQGLQRQITTPSWMEARDESLDHFHFFTVSICPGIRPL
jgi:hypothetical protein